MIVIKTLQDPAFMICRAEYSYRRKKKETYTGIAVGIDCCVHARSVITLLVTGFLIPSVH